MKRLDWLDRPDVEAKILSLIGRGFTDEEIWAVISHSEAPAPSDAEDYANAAAEKAANTREGYAADMRAFAKWCNRHAVSYLPSSPETFADFLSWCAHRGYAASSIGRYCSAIADAHRRAGLPSPFDSRVWTVIRGIRRTVGVQNKFKTPLKADTVMKMLALCPSTLRGLRDAALISIGFASAMRRSELCALQVSDLTEVPDGLRVLIRRSKDDQKGIGQVITIPHGKHIRPVERLQTYLHAAGITEGPVFREVRRGGHIGEVRLTTPSVAGIVKRYVELLGLDPSQYAGHSLRSGRLTTAAEAGASPWAIMKISRHRTLDGLNAYIHPTNGFGRAGEEFV